jgi:hypothetical protein
MSLGSEIKVGDDLLFLGAVHRITDLRPYSHPVVTGGEVWRTAYSRTPAETQVSDRTWGITIDPNGTHYQVGSP